ncbi:MAG: CoA transferase [Chloroflexi bacterium]|nr:CoA transferase [Chloroflexota bacterium]MDA1146833.1 CoA transferase [Chloroflexota bacterium]MQC82446.1 CoA transferase [Chloroflexota bacterium]
MVNARPPDPPDDDLPSAREGVFAGLRVVDFSTGIAGPYATMFLADHGADVIKVEPPAGDPFRASPGFETLNRGKRSLRLDQTGDSRQRRIELLARAADAVIVDLAQPLAAERGIAHEQLAAANPSLVYVAMPPFGDAGPLADQPATPARLAAVSGIMAGQASYSGDPSYLVLPLASYAAGVLGAAAVAGGLYARERWGIGQRIDVPQLAGAAALQVGGVESDQVPVPPLEGAPMGSKGAIPVYRLFQARDGLWFFLACGTPTFFHKLLIAIGHPELSADPRFEHAPWGLATPEASAVLVPLLEDTFRGESRDHWIGVLREYDVPAQPVQTRDEYFDSYTVSANDMRVSIDHPDYEWVEMMGVPLNLTATPGQVFGRAPRLGEHTDDILGELASAAPPLARIANRDPGPHLLEGVRVIDATSFIAGPTLTRHLAMLGADVVKVEAPTGDPFRQHGLGFLGWNQGKRGIALDLREAAGREVLHRLAIDADVVVENYRPGVARRLGMDDATLRALNAQLVTVTAPGWGNDETMSELAAWDPLVQARSGAMHHQGSDEEPVFHSVALNDVMTPAIGLFGVLAALFHRERTDEGQQIELALARTGLAIQAAEFTRVAGAPAGAGFLRGDVDFPGPDAGQRWYRCGDGEPIFLEATREAERAALIGCAGVALHTRQVAAPHGTPPNAIASQSLAGAFATRPRDEWLAALDEAGVPAVPILRRHEAARLPLFTANDLVVTQPHPDWGSTINYGLLLRPTVTRGRLDRTAPRLGEHTHEVLTAAGYTAEEIAALGAAGVAVVPGE